jgi:hypothetical protein
MQMRSKASMKSKIAGGNARGENGLQSLTEYYQELFDIEENINHYSQDEYQNARRKFVKYFITNRLL